MRLVDPPRWPRIVAVIGGGRMGSGIAEAFAAGGLDVRITDATPELSAQARERVVTRARTAVDAGLIDAALLERAERVQACDSVAEAVSGAELVLEAVAEDMDVKHAVLATVENEVGAEVVVATNTSSLPVDRMAEPLTHPERFVGMHWFNPPEWTPGVEVVAAPRTDPAVVERVMSFLRALGKSPAVVKASTGFVANRLQMALLCEAVRCVEDGIATPEEIDEVVRSTFGFRLPLLLLRLLLLRLHQCGHERHPSHRRMVGRAVFASLRCGRSRVHKAIGMVAGGPHAAAETTATCRRCCHDIRRSSLCGAGVGRHAGCRSCSCD